MGNLIEMRLSLLDRNKGEIKAYLDEYKGGLCVHPDVVEEICKVLDESMSLCIQICMDEMEVAISGEHPKMYLSGLHKLLGLYLVQNMSERLMDDHEYRWCNLKYFNDVNFEAFPDNSAAMRSHRLLTHMFHSCFIIPANS